jgi:hypothetical protein
MDIMHLIIRALSILLEVVSALLILKLVDIGLPYIAFIWGYLCIHWTAVGLAILFGIGGDEDWDF